MVLKVINFYSMGNCFPNFFCVSALKVFFYFKYMNTIVKSHQIMKFKKCLPHGLVKTTPFPAKMAYCSMGLQKFIFKETTLLKC